MEKNLENLLYDLMSKNQKKFTELMERANSNFREKYNKELVSRNKDKYHIMDGSSIDDYFKSMEILIEWIDKSIDDIRNYIKPVSYPLFVYLYLELIQKDYWEEGILF
jgi:hypothetical protein